MKLYTRTGDDGSTGLFGGGRVPKHHPRVGAYGHVDELNASLGLGAAVCESNRPVQGRLREILVAVQSRLFDLGADLATPLGGPHEDKIHRIGEAEIVALEGAIDEIDAANAPMKTFVLPGGSELAARLHLARTICRRAERAVVALAEHEAVNPQALIYLNRLADLLFAMARRANGDAGVADVPWTGPGG